MKLLLAALIGTIISINMPDNNNSEELRIINQSQKPLFSFGIITDVQYADIDPAGPRFYRESLSKLREAMNSFKMDSVDFVINLGDLIDRDFDSYKPVLDIIDSSGIKTYHVAGNHDYLIDSRYKKRLPIFKFSQEGYYSFVFDNFRFIFLNGNEISTYISSNKAKIKQASEYIAAMKLNGEINAIDWNGGISSKQLEWLELELIEATSKHEKVFLSCHFPLFPPNMHNLLNNTEISLILEKYRNIIAWFNGHNHAGNYGNFNNIHFVTFKGMVDTENANSFAVIEVYKNKIWINGYGREKSLILGY